MEKYVRFVVYANIPALLFITPAAAHNFVTGGNIVALMAFYNFVLYIIPVSIMFIYLIYSLRNGVNENIKRKVLCCILSTICMVLYVIAWSVTIIFVLPVCLALSYGVVKIYKALSAKKEEQA